MNHSFSPEDNLSLPESFRYREVYLRQRPQHNAYDDFSLRHPKMPLSRRAKLFAPFDALRGFSDLISKAEAKADSRQPALDCLAQKNET